MRLILAEKRDQAKKYATIFSVKKETKEYIEIAPCALFKKGAFITWGQGHLVSLSPPEFYNPDYKEWRVETLPILPDSFKYQVIKQKAKQFNAVKKLANSPNVSEIIIGTDCGREGELIGRTILRVAGVKKPIRRLWTSSLTEAALKKAFNNLLPGESFNNLYLEAAARSYADWLVGLNASRVYTLLLHEEKGRDVYSLGRVQTPLLALIEKREQEIENFTPEPYYEIYADFQINNKTYRGKFFKNETDRLANPSTAESLAVHCKGKEAEVVTVQFDEKSFKPPQFYNLSALQTYANRRFGYSPLRTLEICQALYMRGILSYPRSDSRYITNEEVATFPLIFEKLKNIDMYRSLLPTPIQDISKNKRYVNEANVGDHYAIIPTENVVDPQKLTEDEQKIYDAVVRSIIASHYENAKIRYTKIITIVDDRFTFKTMGTTLIKEGWKKVIENRGVSENDTEEELQELPPIKEHSCNN